MGYKCLECLLSPALRTFILGQENKLNATFPGCVSKRCKQAEPEAQDVGPPVIYVLKTPQLFFQNNNRVMFGFETLPASVSACASR